MRTQLYHVKLIAPDGAHAEFQASEDRAIARSAAQAGINLTTGCLQGRCAICRASVVSGTVKAVRRPSKNATGDPLVRADGFVLLRSVGPASDLMIEALSPWRESDTSK